MKYIQRAYFNLRLLISGRCPQGYGFFERHKSIIKYGFSGGLATAVSLISLYLFHDWLNWGIISAATISFLLAFFVSFILQKFWTFRDKRQDRIAGQLAGYLANGVIGLYLNAFLMHLLVVRVGVWYLGAQVLVSLAIAVQNFLVYKFIIFRKRSHEIIGQ